MLEAQMVDDRCDESNSWKLVALTLFTLWHTMVLGYDVESEMNEVVTLDERGG